MNTVTVSDSGAIMACGMADSTVKVFVLSKASLDIIDIETVIQKQVAENLNQ